jgi:hypothetical protein
MANKIDSQRVDLADGRKVHILTYDDESVRFRITGGTPYTIAEAYLAGGQNDHAIIKIVKLLPRTQGLAPPITADG